MVFRIDNKEEKPAGKIQSKRNANNGCLNLFQHLLKYYYYIGFAVLRLGFRLC